MSTNAFIGMRKDNGLIDGISCCQHGCVENTGKILDNYYFDRYRVECLLKLGNLSVLGPLLGKKINMNNASEYASAENRQCIAYHRDHGEKIKIYENENIKKLCQHYAFVYIFENNDTWKVYHNDQEQLLSDMLKY